MATVDVKGPELLASVLEVFQLLVHYCGTLCRLTWNCLL